MSETDSPENRPKSKKPADTAFRQQRLPAWQPVMTARTVIPAFFLIGAIFVPLGAFFYITSESAQEYVIDYTLDKDCKQCYESFNSSVSCNCTISFKLDSLYKGPVYMYYGLENFYQNHRRYVKSRDDTQLLGEVKTIDSLSKDCKPYRDNGSSVIAPCGAIANSLFNDTLALTYQGNAVPLIRTGIAWPTDKSAKFKNPDLPTSGNLCEAEAFRNTVKPPNWQKPLCELDTEDESNNGYQNEDLIVWMRNAALPNFRKLYRRIDHSTSTFKDGLPAGNYTLDIVYNYPVKDFDGRKKVILATTTWLGGKNPFLGIAYIVVGVICIILAVCFLVIHCKIGKSTEEVADVTQRTPYM